MPPARPVYIAIIGLGGVGATFLTQLEALAQRFASTPNAPAALHLVYLSRSKTSLLGTFAAPLNISSSTADLASSSTAPLSLPDLASTLANRPAGAHCILVDNTSDQSVADSYPLFLNAGTSVVTPNKKAFSSTLALWDAIVAAASPANPHGGLIFHESSVGAGLPVLSTLADLLETGDSVTSIEGVFSGTMSFLFNAFMPLGGGGGSFSAEVATAKQLGYTEPDPRDDLNGLDVARKLTILARLAGLKIAGPTAFPVQSLIPAALESVASADEFMARLPEFDGEMQARKDEASAEGKVLRFVGRIDVGSNEVFVGLRKFDASHPIAALKGSDNIISFSTKRYCESPLVIQGAGAGGELTAMGVLADLVRVVKLAR